MKSAWEADAPKDPHLAVMTKSGTAYAIPKGTVVLLVIDPTKPDEIVPLITGKMSKKYMDFQCACGQEGCTRRVRFSAKWEGRHLAKF